MAWAVDKRELNVVNAFKLSSFLFPQPVWDGHYESAESEIKSDPAFLGLRRLIKSGSASDSAHCLAETRLARIDMAQDADVDVEESLGVDISII